MNKPQAETGLHQQSILPVPARNYIATLRTANVNVEAAAPQESIKMFGRPPSHHTDLYKEFKSLH
jgi:hypothetical protein